MIYHAQHREVLTILETKDLIEKLKYKGITFNFYSEKNAIEFLEQHNYYIKLTAYKTNFIKHNSKYVGLDFMALKDLSTIDMYLKRWILDTSLSIEHFLKVGLLKDIQEKNIDEFHIVKDYLNMHPESQDELKAQRKNQYIKGLLTKYPHPDYPIWAYLEVIPFGKFVNFYTYYYSKYSRCEITSNLLYSVRNIRNAAAHNNCIIHDLRNKNGYYNKQLVDLLVPLLSTTKKRTIQNRLKNNSVQDFISVLLVSNLAIKSQELKTRQLKRIKRLFEGRMIESAYLYKSSPSLIQMYDFCKKVIDKIQ